MNQALTKRLSGSCYRRMQQTVESFKYYSLRSLASTSQRVGFAMLSWYKYLTVANFDDIITYNVYTEPATN